MATINTTEDLDRPNVRFSHTDLTLNVQYNLGDHESFKVTASLNGMVIDVKPEVVERLFAGMVFGYDQRGVPTLDSLTADTP